MMESVLQVISPPSVSNCPLLPALCPLVEGLREAPPPKASRKQAAAGLEDRSWLAFLRHVQGSSGEGLWPTPSLPGILFAGEPLH